MTTMLFCKDKNRRDLVLQNTSNLNGIDYLEVIGTPGCGTQLALTFLKPPGNLGLTAANIQLTGDTAPDHYELSGTDGRRSVDGYDQPGARQETSRAIG